MPERILGVMGAAGRAVVVEQLPEVGLEVAVLERAVLSSLEATQSEQEEQRLVRGALSAALPGPDARERFDEVTLVA
jgi:hypothetical protein